MKKIFTAFIFTALAMTQVAVAQLKFQENVDYSILENPLPVSQEGKKEVLEFFSYSCPHCYNLEPHIVKWAEEDKPEDVVFRQVPAMGGSGGGSWTFLGRVKFVADKLKLGNEFDKAYFDAIHKKRQRRLLGDKDTIIDFIVEHSEVERPQVEKAWDSLHVKNNMKKAIEMMQKSAIDGVPTVIVNGKYMVRLTADYKRFFEVIDFLLATTVPTS